MVCHGAPMDASTEPHSAGRLRRLLVTCGAAIAVFACGYGISSALAPSPQPLEEDDDEVEAPIADEPTAPAER